MDDGRMSQQLVGFAFVRGAFVGAEPDAVAVAVDFTAAVAGPAAGAIALVFGALGFWAKETDFGERTIAAVLAAEEEGF